MTERKRNYFYCKSHNRKCILFVINHIIPDTRTVAVEIASPNWLIALHMYTPESSALSPLMFRATYPKLCTVVIREPKI